MLRKMGNFQNDTLPFVSWSFTLRTRNNCPLFFLSEKEMATHSSVLAWRIPGTGQAGRLPSLGLHRVGHDWSDLVAAFFLSGKKILYAFITWLFCVCVWRKLNVYFFFFYLTGGYLLYNMVVVFPYIDMNQPWVYMCSPSLSHGYLAFSYFFPNCL